MTFADLTSQHGYVNIDGDLQVKELGRVVNNLEKENLVANWNFHYAPKPIEVSQAVNNSSSNASVLGLGILLVVLFVLGKEK